MSIPARASLALLGLLAVAIGAGAAGPASHAVAWQGFGLEVPAGYCVEGQMGPDFLVRYLRAGDDKKAPVLAGIYTGYAPGFHPDCTHPVERTESRHGLSIRSVRGDDGCAEFLVSAPAKSDHALLHLWFGPDARTHSDLAERLVASIGPAATGAKSDEPPACR